MSFYCRQSNKSHTTTANDEKLRGFMIMVYKKGGFRESLFDFMLTFYASWNSKWTDTGTMLIRYGKFAPRYCLWNLAIILATTVFYHRIKKCPTWTLKEITMLPTQHQLYSWWSTNLLKTTQPFIGKKKRIFFTKIILFF